jgi:hypothetical protein
MTNEQQIESTNLVGVKWSKSSLIKCLERNYVISLDRLLSDPNMSREEIMIRSKQMFDMFISIYDPIWNYGVIVKKE